MKAEGIPNENVPQSTEVSMEETGNESDDMNPLVKSAADDENPIDLDRLVFSLLITLAVILGVIIVANIYTIGQTLNAVLFSQRTHLQRSVAKHDLVQSEGGLNCCLKRQHLYLYTCRLPPSC